MEEAASWYNPEQQSPYVNYYTMARQRKLEFNELQVGKIYMFSSLYGLVESHIVKVLNKNNDGSITLEYGENKNVKTIEKQQAKVTPFLLYEAKSEAELSQLSGGKKYKSIRQKSKKNTYKLKKYKTRRVKKLKKTRKYKKY
jgi:ribosome-binding ATPase YchF (GTP1/OBG family)